MIQLPPAFAAGNVAVVAVVAVVTGAASGIGYALASRLLGFGLKVALVDLGGDRLDAAAGRLAPEGEVLAVATDVSSRAEVEQLRDRVVDA